MIVLTIPHQRTGLHSPKSLPQTFSSTCRLRGCCARVADACALWHRKDETDKVVTTVARLKKWSTKPTIRKRPSDSAQEAVLLDFRWGAIDRPVLGSGRCWKPSRDFFFFSLKNHVKQLRLALMWSPDVKLCS